WPSPTLYVCAREQNHYAKIARISRSALALVPPPCPRPLCRPRAQSVVRARGQGATSCTEGICAGEARNGVSGTGVPKRANIFQRCPKGLATKKFAFLA